MGNTLDRQYQDLLFTILNYGIEKQDRTGTGTKSIFGYTIRHNMREGFPLLTTKKMYWKGIVTELLWFLRGDTHVKFLHDNDCHIWDGDLYKNYEKMVKTSIDRAAKEGILRESDDYSILSKESFIDRIKTDAEFSKKWGDLGPIYGYQWRHWGDTELDQIAILINDLKKNPDSRRMMVTAWNPDDLSNMVLPPCHYGFQVYTRELSRDERIQIYVNQYVGGVGKPAGFEDAKLTTRNIPKRAISLMWNQRSVDTFLGLPFNIASYGLLLEIIAREVNMVPEHLIGNLGDVHIYNNHFEQAREQITRDSYALPKLISKDEYWYLKDINITFSEKIERFKPDFFKVEGYQSGLAIKAPLSN